MDIRKLLLTGAVALAPFSVLACASAPGDVSSSSEEAASASSTTAEYFIVTRADMRRCAYPLCGGYYVKGVNNTKITCADGTVAADCRALQFDLTAIGLDDSETQKLDGVLADRHAIVRGKLQTQQISGRGAPVLVASEIWVGNALSTPTGTFYTVTDRGIRCITAPCPSLHEAKLDSATSKEIAGLDLDETTANDKQKQAAIAALADGGVIVAGVNHSKKYVGGYGTELVASEFYTRVVGQPQPKICGGIAGFQCPSGQVCDISIPNACHGADLSGTCITPPQLCYQLFKPVCGCDGQTYTNECYRQKAGVQLDHEGACAQ